MIHICLYRPTGEVALRTAVPSLATAGRLASDFGLPFIEVSGANSDGYVKNDELVPFPEKPSPSAMWSWDTHTWEV